MGHVYDKSYPILSYQLMRSSEVYMNLVSRQLQWGDRDRDTDHGGGGGGGAAVAAGATASVSSSAGGETFAADV